MIIGPRSRRLVLHLAKGSAIIAAVACMFDGATRAAERPNIVLIVADDLGYGDVRALNPQRGRIETPHLDRLAAQGMTFTDAHSGSSVCTPTRYGLLTGRYAWRSHLQRGVFDGSDDPPLIAAGRLDRAGGAQAARISTAAIGKWHLGFDAERRAEPSAAEAEQTCGGGANRGAGAACRLADRRRTDHARLRLFLGLLERPHDVRPDGERSGHRDHRADQHAAATRPACRRVPGRTRRCSESGPADLPLSAAHLAAHADSADTPWQGKSGLGPYGDFVMQTDASSAMCSVRWTALGLAGHHAGRVHQRQRLLARKPASAG
jgi:arylsulfatase A